MAAWVISALLALASPTPTPTPTVTPSPRPRMEQQAERILDQKERSEVPHFESSIDVTAESPAAILDRRLRGLDMECAPAGGGPPTEAETRAVRPHAPPTADFLALGKLIAGKVKGKGPERYFLYRVRRSDSVGYVLREGRMPDAEYYNTVGATFELLETFSDEKEATDGLHRMERDFATAVSPDSGSVPTWSLAPCRPRKP